MTDARANRHRRWPLALVAVGAALLAGSIAWRQVAVPALVRFPTDVDQTIRFDGTATVYVDPATMAPYATPREMPLHIDRHIVAVGGESDHQTVLLREENTIVAGDLPASEQVHQYVMDRVSLANVADARAWAYETANVVDRSGAYWLTFPMHAERATSYEMFKDEIGRRITAGTDPTVAQAAGRPDGLELVGFRVAPDEDTITPAYQRTLGQTAPLPSPVTLTQLDPILKANGIDVTATVAALVPALTPEELTTLTDLANRPIGLVYSTAFSGATAVEPRTGTIVDVTAVDETIAARPDPAAMPPLLAILEAHRDLPEVATALAGLDHMSAEPITLFRYQYAQTRASVLDVAGTVNDKLAQIELVERTLPWAAGLSGGALLIAGIVLVAIRRRPAPAAETEAATTDTAGDVPDRSEASA